MLRRPPRSALCPNTTLFRSWEIFDAIARELGVTPASFPPVRALGRVGVRLSPRRMIDLMLRAGPRGDLFGLRRGGLNLDRVRRSEEHTSELQSRQHLVCRLL